jgi:hypothetical protein
MARAGCSWLGESVPRLAEGFFSGKHPGLFAADAGACPAWNSMISVFNALGCAIVLWQWYSSGQSIADPLFKPVSGESLAYQMASTMALFSTTVFGFCFALGAATILQTKSCSNWLAVRSSLPPPRQSLAQRLLADLLRPRC